MYLPLCTTGSQVASPNNGSRLRTVTFSAPTVSCMTCFLQQHQCNMGPRGSPFKGWVVGTTVVCYC